MTNHIHLLLRVTEKGTISKIMQSGTLAHTKHYHFQYQTNGHVWQGRFKSPIVSDDTYLLDVMRYIELNPVKAGMVKKVSDYRWSSYLLNVRKKGSRLVDSATNPVFSRLGQTDAERTRAYRRVIDEKISPERQEFLEKSISGMGHYMSEQFHKQMHAHLPHKRKRGRPRMNLAVKS